MAHFYSKSMRKATGMSEQSKSYKIRMREAKAKLNEAYEANDKAKKKRKREPYKYKTLSQIGIEPYNMKENDFRIYIENELVLGSLSTSGDYIDKINRRIIDIICFYLCKHYKNMFWFRAELTMPKKYKSDIGKNYISRMIDNLKRMKVNPKSDMNMRDFDMAYLWATEKQKSHNHHYHLLVMLKSNIFIKYISSQIARIWGRALNLEGKAPATIKNFGSITLKDGYDDGHALFELVKAAIYMGKDKGKFAHDVGRRDFGSSRIPKGMELLELIPQEKRNGESFYCQ